MFKKHEIENLIKLTDSVKAKDEFVYSKSAGKYKVTVYKNPDNSRLLFIRNSAGIDAVSMRSKREIDQLIYALQDAKDFID